MPSYRMRNRHPPLNRTNLSYSMHTPRHTRSQMVSPSYPPNRLLEPSEESSDGSSEELSEEEHGLGDPDKSEALFSMYLDRSDEDDRKTTERWKGECDAILTFTGLFSVALAALLALSIPGLQQNPQDTSAFYLGNIYHLLASTTTSQPVLPSPSDPPKFSPPTSAVLVNSLWLLSLLMSLTGALLAVFIQQWARSFLHATQKRHRPHKRARIRAFHREGLEKLCLHRVTRTLPVLIHVSLFLFFAGLPIFLFNVNRTVFDVVVAWLAICIAGYACITLMPVLYQNSPYYSPLSSSIWWCFTNTLFIFHRLFKNFMPDNHFVLKWYDAHYANSHFNWPSLRAMQKAAGRFSRKLPPDIDYRALLQMFKTLNEDDEFEQFFDALPSLCGSKRLKHAQTAFIDKRKKILSHALIGMMDRTLLSELVSEKVKHRRVVICTKVIDTTSLLEPSWILRRVLFGDRMESSRWVHFGLFVQNWAKISDAVTAFYAQFVVAVILAHVQERDNHWFKLAGGQLYKSTSFLRKYYAKDDSILLANAIFIIRRTIQTFSESENLTENLQQSDTDVLKALSTLESICRFSIENTFLELQHEFCSLWNQLMEASRAPQNDTNPGVSQLCDMMLKRVHRLYVPLHETQSAHLAHSTPYYYRALPVGDPVPYTKCIISGHRHATQVPELPLHGLLTDTHMITIDHIRSSTSLLVPELPVMLTTARTYSAPNLVVPSPVALGLSPTAIPTAASHPSPASSYRPVSLGSYSGVSDPYSRPAAPSPSDEIASGTTRLEADSRIHARVSHAQFTCSPEVSRRKRVSVSSASTSRSSSPTLPERQEVLPVIRADANIPISTLAPIPRRSIISRKAVVPETPFVPSPRPLLFVPQGPPVEKNADLIESPVVLSPPSRDEYAPYTSPDPGPSRGSIRIPSEAPQSVSVNSPDIIVVPRDIDSTSDVSVATARRASSSPAPFSTPITGGGRRSGPTQTPASPSVIKFNGYGDSELSGLLYYSLHSVRYEDKLYPTALHLFEARKFLPYRLDLADRIRQCERVEQVPRISAEMADSKRRDWVNVMISTMDEVLYLKFRQHDDLRTLLLNTHPAELVYVEPRDRFWGGDGEGGGANEFGASLMRVRELLREGGRGLSTSDPTTASETN